MAFRIERQFSTLRQPLSRPSVLNFHLADAETLRSGRQCHRLRRTSGLASFVLIRRGGAMSASINLCGRPFRA